MYIIVIGCGKVGSRFATVLSQEGHDVVIVDSEESSFERLDPGFEGLKIHGVPIDQDVLKKAGIEHADALAAVTPDDNVNIMVCQIAKKIYNVKKVIARIYNPAREYVFHQFGLDTICPTNITVDVIRSLVLDEGVSEHTVGSNTVSFRYEKPHKNLIGKKIGEIVIPKDKFLFGIIKNTQFYFAKPEFTIDKDDRLVISQLVD